MSVSHPLLKLLKGVYVLSLKFNSLKIKISRFTNPSSIGRKHQITKTVLFKTVKGFGNFVFNSLSHCIIKGTTVQAHHGLGVMQLCRLSVIVRMITWEVTGGAMDNSTAVDHSKIIRMMIVASGKKSNSCHCCSSSMTLIDSSKYTRSISFTLKTKVKITDSLTHNCISA